MRALPAGLALHLETGTTTLCWCWRLTRRDGVKQGFTDHDRDLQFDATTFEAAAGFEASEVRESLGLAVDNLEITGALSSAALEDADLEAGLYDDAEVEIFRVNWTDVAQRVLMRSGTLGEVKRAGGAFSAEVRGLSHYLQQPKGRLFQYTCDADLGDARCGVALAGSAFTGSGVVTAVTSERVFAASGLDSFGADWFTRGLVTFASGAAAGQKIEVRRHTRNGSVVAFDLWQPVRAPLTAGMTFTVTAGCDKTHTTCRAKFSNIANFRGFPHMPGNDYLTAVARPGQT
ncbi:MAG: beta-tubulin [Hyphomicrobium sp.]|nr:beta-tubulin [Hyphomicrobium sp.]PPD07237.1 MAG: beta tubulin [Hyphomicrobium sp.]